MTTAQSTPIRCNGHNDLLALCNQCIRRQQTPRPVYFLWKGVLDRVLAALLLVPGLPIIGLLIVLVRCTSQGPALFRQTRVGKRGKTFTMYKIRSMRLDAETRTGPVWSPKDDPRITRLGSILRRFHLDELPQLFNVVKGEMSLVGPRPERPEIVCVLVERIPGYLARLAAPPGITGIAQINLPPDTDADSVRRKLALDLEYLRAAGFWLDLRVLVCTAARFGGFSGTLAAWILRLRRNVSLANDPGAAVQTAETIDRGDTLRPPDPPASQALRKTVTLDDSDTLVFENSQAAQRAERPEEVDNLTGDARAEPDGTSTDGNGRLKPNDQTQSVTKVKQTVPRTIADRLRTLKPR